MAKRAKHAEKRVEQMIVAHEAKKPFVEKRPKPVLVTDKLPEKRAVLAKGLTNREIADRLFLSLNTIKVYNRNINSKLDVNSRTKAVVKAKAFGILPSD
jgi:LuxR family maltose regulon positive regulatory protein